MTTIMLVAGFSSVLFGEARDHRMFATMGALTISAALFGDLVFLPVLLARFGLREAAKGRSGDVASEDLKIFSHPDFTMQR